MPQCIPVSEHHEHPDTLAPWPFPYWQLEKWPMSFEHWLLLLEVSWIDLMRVMRVSNMIELDLRETSTWGSSAA